MRRTVGARSQCRAVRTGRAGEGAAAAPSRHKDRTCGWLARWGLAGGLVRRTLAGARRLLGTGRRAAASLLLGLPSEIGDDLIGDVELAVVEHHRAIHALHDRVAIFGLHLGTAEPKHQADRILLGKLPNHALDLVVRREIKLRLALHEVLALELRVG